VNLICEGFAFLDIARIGKKNHVINRMLRENNIDFECFIIGHWEYCGKARKKDQSGVKFRMVIIRGDCWTEATARIPPTGGPTKFRPGSPLKPVNEWIYGKSGFSENCKMPRHAILTCSFIIPGSDILTRILVCERDGRKGSGMMSYSRRGGLDVNNLITCDQSNRSTYKIS